MLSMGGVMFVGGVKSGNLVVVGVDVAWVALYYAYIDVDESFELLDSQNR